MGPFTKGPIIQYQLLFQKVHLKEPGSFLKQLHGLVGSDADHIAVNDVFADHDEVATLLDVPDPDDPAAVHLERLKRAVRHVTLAFETRL